MADNSKVNKKSAEKRQSIICPKCSNPMVFMNKYKIFKSGSAKKDVALWYKCPSRQDESGCGYKTLIL